MTKCYSGIGSRQTPPVQLEIMTKIATKLARKGWTLRSGGAIGADKAFAKGVGIWHPGQIFIFKAQDATPEAIQLASKFHPAWDKCSEYAKSLHGRNMMILLGEHLDTPVKFVIAWTPNGALVGGTAQCLRAAIHYKIPVFNLALEKDYSRIKKFLEKE